MSRWAILACVCVAVSLFVAARPTAASPKAEDEITQLERDWLAAEASADMPTLKRLIADDFMGTGFGPNLLSKEDVVPSDGNSENRMPKSTLKESAVRVFGDTAILMGSVSMGGANTAGIRVTTVFQKRPQGWQMIATHMSRLTEQ